MQPSPMHPSQKRPCLVDAAAADVVQQIVEASRLEPESFRFLHIANRPSVAPDATTVGFQYFRYGIGGGEKVTQALIEVFCKQGRRAILYVDELVDSGEELGLPEGATCKIVPLGPEERAAFWAHEVETEHLRCMVYGSWTSPRATLDCLALQTAGAAFVLETHSTATSLFDNPDNERCWTDVLRCIRAADLVVCLSDSDRIFWETFNANVRCVLNPIDSRMEEKPSQDETAPSYDVLFCGRLSTQEKRPDEALRAFAAARHRLPSIRMAFVGDGEARDELERLGKELGVADAVDFLGFVSNPRDLIKKAGVLVLTSPSEGFPLVLTEAACLGTPCVVYEMPHLTVLRGNGGAIQVPQGDWEEAGAAITSLLSNKDLHSQASQATRAFYEQKIKTNQALVWSRIIDDAATVANEGHVSPQPIDDPMHALVFNAVAASRREAARCKDFEDRMNTEWRRANAECERANAAEEELRAVRGSLSFRIGKALTWLPRKLRETLR